MIIIIIIITIVHAYKQTDRQTRPDKTKKADSKG